MEFNAFAVPMLNIGFGCVVMATETGPVIAYRHFVQNCHSNIISIKKNTLLFSYLIFVTRVVVPYNNYTDY